MAALTTTGFGQSQDPSTGAAVLGQGKYQWRVVPGWGVLDGSTPVKDCHGMIQTKDGRIFLLTNETKNNVIIYDKAGKLLGKWGTEWPGAHGFTLLVENGEEYFYVTDHDRHQFYKTTLDGKVLRTWDYPEQSGKYKSAGEFKPTHVALAPDGGFFVVDGYGKSWCHRYDAKGEWVKCFGGNEPGDAKLVCAHGAWVDTRDSKNLLWITSRSEGKLKRYTLDGALVDVLDLPGGAPNFIVPFGDHTVIPHLRGNQNQPDKALPINGFLSILDPQRKLISNLAAPAPAYADDGKLARLGSDTKVFTYPHGILIDDEQSIYIAQWNSGRTYPIKLERVKA
ncbi:peptidylglycine monooxygenase [Luteolibacter sp. LG18]|nr:peptidylglycine monooxygenase [Luteolibacter sp. LG18]